MRETVTGFECPDSAAMRPHLLRSMRGAILFWPFLPPVVEMKEPSDDHDSLLNMLICCPL